MLTALGLYNEMANRISSQSMPNNPRVKKYLLYRPNEELFVTSYHSASSKNPCWAGIVRRVSWILGITGKGIESKAGLGHCTNPRYIYVLNNVRNGHTHPSNNVLYLEKVWKRMRLIRKPGRALPQRADSVSSAWKRDYWKSMKSRGKWKWNCYFPFLALSDAQAAQQDRGSRFWTTRMQRFYSHVI